MSKLFPTVPLGQIAAISMGQSPNSSTVSELGAAGLPFLQGNAEFGEKHPFPKYSCISPPRIGEAGSTLISVRAPVGHTNIADRDYCIGRGLAAVKSSQYGPVLCRSIMAQQARALKKVSQGTTFEAIGRDDLFSLLIPQIPLKEAEFIERILDTLDTQIQKTEALIVKLEKIKEGLLHDLLTRGINQNGQLRPTPEQAPELYRESALGLIPKEWYVSDLGATSLSSVIGPFGSDLVASDYRSEGVPVVFVRDIASTKYNRVSDVFVDHRKAKALSAHEVKPGDLLLTKMGLPPCISAVYPDSEPAGVITADIVRLRLKADVAPEWAHYFVNSEAVKSQVRGITAGVTRPKVTLKDTRSLKIAVPDFEEQARILNIIQHSSSRLESEGANLEKLKAQKSGLMGDLLTGRVRVTPLLANS